jgi:hypothetical protein
MPDDDRFERLLRGRGWRGAYRLAAGNSTMPLLVDSLIKAAAHALRNQAQSPSLSKVMNVLRESMTFQSLSDGRKTSGGLDGFERLRNGLDQIEADDLGYVGTQLAIRAAEKVFVEQSRQTGAVSSEEIQDRLGETFVADLVDHQWLSRVRTGVADKNNRNVDQQLAWEQGLRESMKPQARKLFRSAAKADDSRDVRAPRSVATPPPSLEIQLHEPLVPLQR